MPTSIEPMTSHNSSASRRFPRSAVLADFENVVSSRVRDRQTVSKVLSAIERWTGGQPTLTRILCDCVLESTSQVDNDLDATIVDAVVQRQIIERWNHNAAADHLNKIEDAVLSYEVRDSLLILYLQILQRGSAAANNSSEQEVLLRSGLVVLEGGRLKVANPIYAKIFNLIWIERQVPGLTRPVSIVSAKSSRKTLPRPSLVPGGIARLLGFLALAGVALAIVRGLTQGSQGIPNLAASAEISETAEGKVAEGKVAKENAGGDFPQAEASVPVAEGLTQLTLLADTFSGYSTFRNGDFQAALKEVGLAIDYSDEFDQSLRAEQLSTGEADLMLTTLDQFLQQQPKGKIVGLIDRTVGADAVVLNTRRYPTLKSLLDLERVVAQALANGKTLSIVYAEDTPSEYLAMVLDAKFDNFDLADFELRPVAEASEAWKLLQNPADNVAIAVLWEPYVTQAQQQGYSVVLSSDDAPNAIVDVLVASDQLIERDPDKISRLLETYYRRIDANARDATQLQTQVAEDGNLPMNEAMTVINGIDFFTATEAKNWMDDGTLETRVEATAAVLKLADELETLPADVTALYRSQHLTQAANNTQILIDLIRADNPDLADTLAGKGRFGAVADVSPSKIQQAPDIGTLKTSGQVGFATGSAELTAEGTETLQQVASELKDFNDQNVAVRIIGHTSKTGDAEANVQLSQARTRVVAERLKGLGVRLSFLPEGKGFSEPLPGVSPTDSRNQRTEIRLVRVN